VITTSLLGRRNASEPLGLIPLKRSRNNDGGGDSDDDADLFKDEDDLVEQK
jgi:hypothetical protein